MTAGRFPRLNLPPRLSPTEEAYLLSRLQTGDRDVRRVLIERTLRLVPYIVARDFRVASAYVGFEDLVSIGTIGLIDAVDNFSFDPTRPLSITNFAAQCIRFHILNYLTRERRLKRRPTGGRLSLDAPIGETSDSLSLSDVLGTDPDIVYRELEDEVDRLRHERNRVFLREAMATLPERDRTIIELHYGLNGNREHTQEEIGARLGMREHAVTWRETRTIKRLRQVMENLRRLSRADEDPRCVSGAMETRGDPSARCRMCARRPKPASSDCLGVTYPDYGCFAFESDPRMVARQLWDIVEYAGTRSCRSELFWLIVDHQKYSLAWKTPAGGDGNPDFWQTPETWARFIARAAKEAESVERRENLENLRDSQGLLPLHVLQALMAEQTQQVGLEEATQ